MAQQPTQLDEFLDPNGIAEQFWKRSASSTGKDAGGICVGVQKDTANSAPPTMYAPACAFNVFSEVRKLVLSEQMSHRAEKATEIRIPHTQQVGYTPIALHLPLCPPP